MSDHHKEPLDKGSALMQKLLLAGITAIVSISITFATTEHALCSGVREDNIQTKAEMKNLKEEYAHLRDEYAQIRTLLDTIVRLDTESITLLKVQQQVKGP